MKIVRHFALFTGALAVLFSHLFADVTVNQADKNLIFCEVENSRLVITEKGGFNFVNCDGCVCEFIVGQPRLPVKTFSVALPEGKALDGFEIERIEKIKLEGNYTITAVSPPRIISRMQVAKCMLQASVSSGEILKLNSVQKSGSLSAAFFSIRAASYDAAKKELYWIKSIRFRIILKSAGVQPLKKSITNRKLLRCLVVNPEMITPSDVKTTQTEMYLIITSNELKSSFQKLADSKSSLFDCEIKTVEEIYGSYTGKDNQEKIRNCIISYYGSNNLKYVLLGGDTNIVPARGVYAKVTGAVLLETEVEDDNIPCDLYYAALDGNWDTDGDEIYGEVSSASGGGGAAGDEADFLPEVFVGRAPVNSVHEAENFVNKANQYRLQNNFRNLLLGCELDAANDGKDLMLKVKAEMSPDFEIAEKYESDGTLSKAAVTDEINSGVDFINHAGHGNYNWLDTFFDISTVRNLTNDRPFVFYSIGCYAGAFDYNDCIGEEFVKNSYGGCTFIGNSRFGFYDENDATLYSGEFMVDFYRVLFSTADKNMGSAFYESKANYIVQSSTSTAYRWIQFCLNLLGDPEMLLPAVKEIEFVSYTVNAPLPLLVEIDVENELTVNIKNLKAYDLANVRAEISENDTYVEVVSSFSVLGTIPANSETSFSFKFKVLANCPCEHTINFSLLVNTTGYGYLRTCLIPVALKADSLAKVYNYPNPSYGQNVNIVNIPQNSEPVIRIYTLSGEEVTVLREGSGLVNAPASMKAEWDLKNEMGFPVASGVYYYFLQSNAGNAKGKIALIR